VIATPGHTSGHIVYYFAEDELLFCGDTLFVMGCGRLFEGSAADLWQSLQKLKVLPAATRVYCAHEYSQNNGRFALTVEPDNLALQEKMSQVNELRSKGLPTVPSTIGEELATNPFLRDHSPSLQARFKDIIHSPVDLFAKLRTLKDSF
jgi:hydroxyacylglutathione hydrolase